jgi:hypothetical protein
MVVSDYSESNVVTSELTIDLGNGPGWLVYPFAASLWWFVANPGADGRQFRVCSMPVECTVD